MSFFLKSWKLIISMNQYLYRELLQMHKIKLIK